MKRGTGAVLICLQFLAGGLRAQIAGHVVISELYGSGGNAGAVYRNDYVELYNPSPVEAALSGWSVQYASATGTGSWHSAPLGRHISPFGFYLVQLSGGTNGAALPAPDTTGGINMSSTAGKVALVKGTLPLTGANPADTLIVDMVGYGDANGYEGSSPAPAAGTAASLERKAGPLATAAGMAAGGSDENHGNGWDSNGNGMDFVAQKAPSPQNSLSSPERPPDDLLPVRFGSLNAVLQRNSTVEISWSTFSEIACYGFEVERSGNHTGAFTAVSGLIPGHGTTILTHYYSYSDPAGAAGDFYRIREIDTNGAEWFSESCEAAPVSSVQRPERRDYSLLQNYPNPFNPATRIDYRLPGTGYANVRIFDALGRLIDTLFAGNQTEGKHTVTWDATGTPAGVYFCRLEVGGLVRTIRVVLIR